MRHILQLRHKACCNCEDTSYIETESKPARRLDRRDQCTGAAMQDPNETRVNALKRPIALSVNAFSDLFFLTWDPQT